MTVTVSRAELEKLFKELASKSAEAEEDEDNEILDGEEDESIGAEALRRMNSKKRPRSEDLLQEWLDRNGSSSSSSRDHKKLAVVAQSDIRCTGMDATALHSVACQRMESVMMRENYRPCSKPNNG